MGGCYFPTMVLVTLVSPVMFVAAALTVPEAMLPASVVVADAVWVVTAEVAALTVLERMSVLDTVIGPEVLVVVVGEPVRSCVSDVTAAAFSAVELTLVAPTSVVTPVRLEVAVWVCAATVLVRDSFVVSTSCAFALLAAAVEIIAQSAAPINKERIFMTVSFGCFVGRTPAQPEKGSCLWYQSEARNSTPPETLCLSWCGSLASHEGLPVISDTR